MLPIKNILLSAGELGFKNYLSCTYYRKMHSALLKLGITVNRHEALHAWHVASLLFEHHNLRGFL